MRIFVTHLGNFTAEKSTTINCKPNMLSIPNGVLDIFSLFPDISPMYHVTSLLLHFQYNRVILFVMQQHFFISNANFCRTIKNGFECDNRGKNSFERAFEAFVMQSIKKQKSRAGKDS